MHSWNSFKVFSTYIIRARTDWLQPRGCNSSLSLLWGKAAGGSLLTARKGCHQTDKSVVRDETSQKLKPLHWGFQMLTQISAIFRWDNKHSAADHIFYSHKQFHVIIRLIGKIWSCLFSPLCVKSFPCFSFPLLFSLAASHTPFLLSSSLEEHCG